LATVFSRAVGWCRRVSGGILAVSAGLSAALSAGFSAAGFSAADLSRTAFSEMPLALTPGSGMLATSADGSAFEALASAFGLAVDVAATTGASGLETM